jgi:nicotinamidase-related amidase
MPKSKTRSHLRNVKNSRSLGTGTVALLIIDLISDFRFEDGATIARAALPAARRIAALRQRALRAGVPNLFVNDNLGRWKSDFRQLVARCGHKACLGAPIVKLLTPGAADYFVLKPTHGGFFGTPLDRLLEELATKTLILSGISAHQCVLFTANEAYLRDFRLVIPRDCVASKTERQRKFALDYFKSVLHADIRASTALRFTRRAAGRAKRQ